MKAAAAEIGRITLALVLIILTAYFLYAVATLAAH